MHSISVIIPSNHGPKDCEPLFACLAAQSRIPDEIVFVDSSRAANEGVDWGRACFANHPKLRFMHIKQERCYPGEARNIGVRNSGGSVLAFIDVKTLPEPQWLERALAQMEQRRLDGVWGSTGFSATSTVQRLVKDGIYGAKPRRTLPGLVIKADAFRRVGEFFAWPRAAEDTEWMSRATAMRMRLGDPESHRLLYVGMEQSRLSDLVRRWYRNYCAAAQLRHLRFQSLFMVLLVYAVTATLAFNWNAVLAGWETDSPYYVDHITKLVMGVPLLAYAGLRGLFIPVKRGVLLRDLLPLRFLGVTWVCAILDLTKLSALIWGRMRVPPKV